MKTSAFFVLASLLFFCARLGVVNGEGLERPNVIVILVDDLGYGDLSSYGATDLNSPHIDQLVASGMKFTQFYANCPVCSPTRASLLTGQYPELVGVPGVIRTHANDSWGFLDPECQTLPELLKASGYDTAIIGKWHLGLSSPNVPTERGFNFFKGFLGDMMDDYYHHRRHGVNYMRLGTQAIDPAGHATDLFTGWACDYLRSRAEHDNPFFLYLAYNAPHTPIQPPDDWLEKVNARNTIKDKQRAKLVALIEHLDYGIGQVLTTLQELPIHKNTIVVFTSDNGGQLNVGARNGRLRDGKQSMYEGGLKVPACISWPGHITPGSECEQTVMTMDLLPTICELTKSDFAPHQIDGMSFVPTLTGKAQPELSNRPLFFHRREGGQRYGGLVINAVRFGRWKLVQNSPFAPRELYDLQSDPLEEHDLSHDRPAEFRRLAGLLSIQIQRGGAVPWQPSDRRAATRTK